MAFLLTINYNLVYLYIKKLSISYYWKQPEYRVVYTMNFFLSHVCGGQLSSVELNSSQLLDCKLRVGFKSILYMYCILRSWLPSICFLIADNRAKTNNPKHNASWVIILELVWCYIHPYILSHNKSCDKNVD